MSWSWVLGHVEGQILRKFGNASFGNRPHYQQSNHLRYRTMRPSHSML
jgi:hypothetical protein